MRFDLSDDEWAHLEPLMPKSGHIVMGSFAVGSSPQQRAHEEQGDCIMSVIKQRGSVDMDRSEMGRSEMGRSDEVELEGRIHELVRRDGNAIRRPDSDGEVAARNLGDLLRRVSANSTSEIDNLIGELQILREKLLADGNRVERDIVEYAALSQSEVDMTKIITDSMTQVKKLPAAPSLTPKDIV
jgi:hypothetical protein